MTQPMDRRELRLRHAVHTLRNAVTDDERILELKLVEKLIEVFHDDKEGLLQALKLAHIKPKKEPVKPEIVMHAVRSKL